MSRAAFDAALGGEGRAFGVSLRYAEPSILEMIGPSVDFAWIDMQHGTVSLRDVAMVARVADLVGTALLVRVPDAAPGLIGAVLDLDVAGVIVPLVEDAVAARAIVVASRFPPLGNRSYGGRRIIDRRGGSYVEGVARRQVVVCQVESPAAVARAEEIIAVAGVDALMPGPDDLALRRDPGHPTVDDLVTQAAGAVLRAGKQWVAVVANQRDADLAVGRGSRLVSVSSDHAFIRQGAAAAREAFDRSAPR